MNIFHFFINQNTVVSGVNKQLPTQAFGSMSASGGQDRYRVVSLHSSVSTEKIYAICSGKVAVQAVTLSLTDIPIVTPATALPDLINIIVKPTQDEQTDVRFPQIKYIIYKGILKSSLIDSSGNITAPPPGNIIDLAAVIADNQVKLNAATGLTNSASANILGYDKIASIPQFADTDPIDHLFYDPFKASQLIHAGNSIGEAYHGLFGIEIILESPNYNPTLDIARRLDHIITVPTLPASPNNSQLFEHWNLKEEVLNYLDPCAFFGSLYTSKLNVSIGGTFSTITANDIYDKVLLGINPAFDDSAADSGLFFNRKKVYIDIRNDHNHALNYYRNYTDEVEIKGSATVPSVNYYRSGWPILTWELSDFITGNTTFKNDISIRLPKGDNINPLVFVSQGFRLIPNTEFSEFKVQRGKDRFIDAIVPADTVTSTQEFTLETPNYFPNNGKGTYPIAAYIKLRYYKRSPATAGTNFVPAGNDFLDNVFLPLKMKAPFAPSTSIITKVYREEVLVNEEETRGFLFVANIGIAIDQGSCVYFLFPAERMEVMDDTQPDETLISLITEATDNQEYYLRHLDKRFQSLSQKNLLKDAGRLLFSALSPTEFQILKFEDDIYDRKTRLTNVSLASDFYAIMIDTSLHNQMIAQAASLSANYDIRLGIVNRNSHGATDNNSRPYNSFELVLRGYNVTGSSNTLAIVQSADLSTLSAGNIEVFGYSNGLIFKDRISTIPPEAGDILLGTCAGLTQIDLEYFKEFIIELRKAANIPPLAGRIAHKPSKILYDNIIHRNPDPNEPDDVYVTGSSPSLSLVKPDPMNLPTGILAELAYTFSIYKLSKQLEEAYTIPGQAMLPLSSQSKIYQELSAVVMTPSRFNYKSTTITAADRMAVNKALLNASQSMQDLVEMMKLVISPPPDPRRGPTPFGASERGLLKKRIIDLLKFNIYGDILKENKERSKIIKPIITKLIEVAQMRAKAEAACFFREFYPTSPIPVMDMLGAGDGGGSASLFGQINLGILFYNNIVEDLMIKVVKEVHSESYKTFGLGYRTVLHLATYGITFVHAADSKNEYNFLTLKIGSHVIVFGSRIYDNLSDYPNQSILWKPIQPDSTAIFKSINVTIEPSPTATNTFIIDGVTPNIRLGTFCITTQDFIFDSTDVINFNITVKAASFKHLSVLDSSTSPPSFIPIELIEAEIDEIAASINIAQIPGPILTLTSPTLFGDDRFEVLDTEKFNLLNTQTEIDATQTIVYLIINGSPLFFDLQGNYIGKHIKEAPPHGSAVIKDTNYGLGEKMKEHGNPPAPGSKLAKEYEKIRYSFARIEYNVGGITFHIESYASPLYSRLDKRFLNIGNPQSFDYRGTTFNQPRKDSLDLHTHFGQLPLTSPMCFSDINISSNYKFPSYNQVLTALRCFGFLEAIFFRIRKEAKNMFDASLINTTQLAFVKNTLNNYMTTNLSDGPIVTTLFDVTTGEQKFLTAEDYQYYKWYTSATEINDYDGDGY
ncbi:MAG: hypothetical protein ACK5Z2_00160 [Bacteroidota bacterium]